MWTQPYGKTGKDISVIGCGGMRFADWNDIDAGAAVVRAAYERGVNYFDTAPYYCDDRSEEIFGAAFRHMDRDRFYCSTKCMDSDGGDLRASLERSLTRLGVETIDFFHIWCIIHWEQWDERRKGGAVAAAIKAKEEGLINHLVVSSHLPSEQLRRLLAEGPFDGVTVGYCAINFAYREQAVQAAADMGLGVVAMNPLGGGIIPRNAERFDFLRGERDDSVTQAAIRFCVSNPAVTSALVGFSTVEHVHEACDAVEGFHPYPPEHIESVREKVLEGFDELCTGCGYCLPCPQGVDVPRMMDAYNQKILAAGDDGAITSRLQAHWQLPPEHAASCSLCGACEERCTQRLPIRERLKHVAKLD
jgi:hypothetical protein